MINEALETSILKEEVKLATPISRNNASATITIGLLQGWWADLGIPTKMLQDKALSP